jgi:CyaY protein
MDESRYQTLAHQAFETIETMLEEVDADAVDVERSGDVVTLTFCGGKKAVINTQRPTRQIWVAANARAWHFSWDETTGRWLDDKQRDVELFAQISAIVEEGAGVRLPR